MPHLGSWLKPSFHQHGFNQQKNDQKSAFIGHTCESGDNHQ